MMRHSVMLDMLSNVLTLLTKRTETISLFLRFFSHFLLYASLQRSICERYMEKTVIIEPVNSGMIPSSA